MDKRSILAMVIIAVIIVLMPYYQRMISGGKPVKKEKTLQTEKVDSSKQISDKKEKEEAVKNIPEEIPEEKKEKEEKIFVGNIIQDSTTHTIDIQSDILRVRISNKGGGTLEKYELLKYDSFDSSKVNMIDKSINNHTDLSFQNVNGEFIDTKNYLFKTSQKKSEIKLNKGETFKIKYTLYFGEQYLEKTLIFYSDRYNFDVVIKFSNPSAMILNRNYPVT